MMWTLTKTRYTDNYVIILNLLLAVCGDGNYYKFQFNDKGESNREISQNFLEMTDGGT